MNGHSAGLVSGTQPNLWKVIHRGHSQLRSFPAVLFFMGRQRLSCRLVHNNMFVGWFGFQVGWLVGVVGRLGS